MSAETEVTLTGAEEMRALLAGARTLAIVGLSADPSRPSHAVAAYLQRAGYTIYGVNPNYAGREILGRPVYGAPAEVPVLIDIAVIFRRAPAALEAVEAAIAAGARAVWMQIGVINPLAARRAREAGLPVVMDRCMAVDHRRLLAG
jgi:predicted CoA-binding protein